MGTTRIDIIPISELADLEMRQDAKRFNVTAYRVWFEDDTLPPAQIILFGQRIAIHWGKYTVWTDFPLGGDIVSVVAACMAKMDGHP